MKYVITSLVSVRGLTLVRLSAITGIWFESTSGWGKERHAKWTNHLCDSMLFDTEAQAWDKAYGLWGKQFTDTCFMVSSVKEAAIQDARNRKALEANG